MRTTKTIRNLLIVSAVLAPFAFVSSTLKPWIGRNFLVGWVQEVVFPMEYAWHSLWRGVRAFSDHYLFLNDAAQENTRLRLQLQRLQSRLFDYEEQLAENERLRKLLGFAQRFQRETILAEIFSQSSRTAFQSMRIAKGSLDGVAIGMPVVAADGIVGRVLRIGLKYADVQLMVDANFFLDVLVQRTRVRGILSGYSSNRCRLKLHRRAEIKIGDTLITSGKVGGFPKGVPVGRVVRISYDSDNITQVISVEPWVDHTRVEEVMVLYNLDKDIQVIRETAGPEWIMGRKEQS